jgi:hypothetical protein
MIPKTLSVPEAAKALGVHRRTVLRRIASGYYEEHESLLDEGWTVHRWSAQGGYANYGKGKRQGEINRHKEALFFSPHCHESGLQRFVDLGVLSDEVMA